MWLYLQTLAAVLREIKEPSVTLILVNLDGMMIVEKALCCVVEVEVFLRVLLGTMEEAMTLVIIGAAMLVLAMAVMLSAPTTVALVVIVEVLSDIVEMISVSPGIVLV